MSENEKICNNNLNNIVNDLKNNFSYNKENFDGYGLKINADIYSNENNIRQKVDEKLSEIKNNKFIILFKYHDHPLNDKFIHVVTHGNGWCFFYSLGSLNHTAFQNYLNKRFKQSMDLIFNNEQIKINLENLNDILSQIKDEKLSKKLEIFFTLFEQTKKILTDNIIDNNVLIQENLFIKLKNFDCDIKSFFTDYLNYYNSIKNKIDPLLNDILSLLKNCNDFITLNEIKGDELGLDIEEDVIPAYKEYSKLKGSIALFIRDIEIINDKKIIAEYWLYFKNGDVEYKTNNDNNFDADYYVSFDNVHASKLLKIKYENFELKDIFKELNKMGICVFYGIENEVEIYE